VKRATDGTWRARIRFGQDRQFRLTLPATMTPAQAERRFERLKEVAALLGNLPEGEARTILQRATDAKTLEDFEKIHTVAKQEAKAAPAPRRSTAPVVTFRQLGERWTGGELHTRYPDHVKLKRSAELDGQRLEVLYATIGDVELHAFSVDDAERAMAALPAGRSPATRRHYAQLISKVLNLAQYPCRVIDRSPLPRGFLPKIGRQPAFPFLYPAEDARLLACADLPVAARMLYGVLAREGLRLSEALGLRWHHLNLGIGTIRLDRTKTGDVREWSLNEDVAKALAAWRCGAPADSAVFTLGGDPEKAAEAFRAHLKIAGVLRAELHEKLPGRRPMRVHDLRATFITLELAAGRSESWVQDRTGHTTSAMLNRYRRQARHAAELNLGKLAPLNLAIPELSLLPVPLAVPAAKGSNPMPAKNLNDFNSTEDRSRTGKGLPPADFESAASANSATSAH
jgi:integrase